MASFLPLRPGDIPGLPSALAAAHELLCLSRWLEEAERKVILEVYGRIDSDNEQGFIQVLTSIPPGQVIPHVASVETLQETTVWSKTDTR